MKSNPFRATATHDARVGTTKLEVHLDLAIAYSFTDVAMVVCQADLMAEVVSLLKNAAALGMTEVIGSLEATDGADIRKAVEAALAHPIIQGDEYTRD